jgi:uncharacterized repeat protein (TIGR01451 family)
MVIQSHMISNSIKTKLTASAFLIAGLLMIAPTVSAQTCTTQYGGSTTCTSNTITINKKVLNPITNTYVENMSSTDTAFTAGASEVLYSITVTNNSSQTISQVKVTDTLPDPLSFESGPGTYSGKTLTYMIDSIRSGQSRTDYVLTRVNASQTAFFCVRNTATVSLTEKANVDTDQAQICVTTSAGGITALPVAGFNDLMLMIPFAVTGLAGLGLLNKKS